MITLMTPSQSRCRRFFHSTKLYIIHTLSHLKCHHASLKQPIIEKPQCHPNPFPHLLCDASLFSARLLVNQMNQNGMEAENT